jgi:hypothetical protein
VENLAAYVQNWLEQLRNDHKLIVQAAAQAQKAADFILGVKQEEAPAEPKETVTAWNFPTLGAAVNAGSGFGIYSKSFVAFCIAPICHFG